MPRGLIGIPENGRGMNGCHHTRPQRRIQQLAAMLRYAEVAPQDSLRRRSPQQQNHSELDCGIFGLELRLAGRDFRRVRSMMNASLALPRPLELLYVVDYVHL